jgi:hypothetical protein
MENKKRVLFRQSGSSPEQRVKEFEEAKKAYYQQNKFYIEECMRNLIMKHRRLSGANGSNNYTGRIM